MYNIPHPNKTFIADFMHENEFGNVKYVIVVAASDKETAQNHLSRLFGIKPELVWLMNCDHQIIYDSTGRKLEVQAKIIYNTHAKLN